MNKPYIDPTDTHALQREQAKATIESVFSSLVQNKMRHRIPEELFVREFLPYFSGQKIDAPQDNVMAKWISIAGSPTSEVELMDGAGMVVGVVPAIFDTGFINPEKSKELTISRITDRYELERTNPINNASNNMMQQLLSKVPTSADSKSTASESQTQRWYNLFDRYGVGGSDQRQNKTAENKLATGSDEELDFGDL